MQIHIVDVPSAPTTVPTPNPEKPKPTRGMWPMALSLRPSGRLTHRCATGDEDSLEIAEAWRFPKKDDVTLVAHDEYESLVERGRCTFEPGTGPGLGAARVRSIPGFTAATTALNEASIAWKQNACPESLDALALALQHYAERLCTNDDTMRGLDQQADEASEFFLHAWQNRDKWLEQSSFATWVFRVFHFWSLERFKGTIESPGLNFYRDDMRGLHSVIQESDEDGEFYVAAVALQTDQQIEAEHDSYEAVREAIAQCDPRAQDIGRLIAAGYQAQESCEILGVSFKTFAKWKGQIENALLPFAEGRSKKAGKNHSQDRSSMVQKEAA